MTFKYSKGQMVEVEAIEGLLDKGFEAFGYRLMLDFNDEQSDLPVLTVWVPDLGAVIEADYYAIAIVELDGMVEEVYIPTFPDYLAFMNLVRGHVELMLSDKRFDRYGVQQEG